jgi:hypothetical protein
MRKKISFGKKCVARIIAREKSQGWHSYKLLDHS